MHALIDSGEVPRGEKMLYSGTDPESYITEYTLVHIHPWYMEMNNNLYKLLFYICLQCLQSPV